MLRKALPYSLYRILFGDRRRYGLRIDPGDEDYLCWQSNMERVYRDNQKGTIGRIVNAWGFKIFDRIDFDKKNIIEIGPGIIDHCSFWRNTPEQYILVDIRESFLKASEDIIRRQGIEKVSTIHSDGYSIPCPSECADIILTFHQLEHVQALELFLTEVERLLRPGGLLVGAVPCEGGLAWGLGRFLTSRRYVKRKMNFDYDKIICWEHPQFVETIESALGRFFRPHTSIKRPFGLLPFDFNLSWSFIYKKDECLR